MLIFYKVFSYWNAQNIFTCMQIKDIQISSKEAAYWLSFYEPMGK